MSQCWPPCIVTVCPSLVAWDPCSIHITSPEPGANRWLEMLARWLVHKRHDPLQIQAWALPTSSTPHSVWALSSVPTLGSTDPPASLGPFSLCPHPFPRHAATSTPPSSLPLYPYPPQVSHLELPQGQGAGWHPVRQLSWPEGCVPQPRGKRSPRNG